MNIDQYRAIKAQEASAPPTTSAPPQSEPEKQVNTEPVQEETKPTAPEKVTIEGVGEVSFDELKKGYLRQSDYTKKTQELANKRKEAEQALALMEQLKTNPQAIESLKQNIPAVGQLDPTVQALRQMQDQIYDLKLENEIKTLQGKYADFEVLDVLKVAQENQMDNLEKAYKLWKSESQPQTTNIEQLKAQIRQELLKEFGVKDEALETTITTGGAPPQVNEGPKLSAAEKRVAYNLKMSEAEYAKWRDVDRPKK